MREPGGTASFSHSLVSRCVARAVGRPYLSEDAGGHTSEPRDAVAMSRPCGCRQPPSHSRGDDRVTRRTSRRKPPPFTCSSSPSRRRRRDDRPPRRSSASDQTVRATGRYQAVRCRRSHQFHLPAGEENSLAGDAGGGPSPTLSRQDRTMRCLSGGEWVSAGWKHCFWSGGLAVAPTCNAPSRACDRPTTSRKCAWSNVEFIAGDGSVNEIDLTRRHSRGFFPSRSSRSPGSCSATGNDGASTPQRLRGPYDHPLIPANTKAKAAALVAGPASRHSATNGRRG